MKQGTVSVLFGAHSPVHSLLVLIAWVRLYHSLPKPWELVCIAVHDIGHWGTEYLNDYQAKTGHWKAGASWAYRLFGQKGYDFVAGHCSYNGQTRSALFEPDKYSWVIAPWWWMWTNTLFEPKLIRPGRSRRQSARDFQRAMYENWLVGFPKQGHDIYLEQWIGGQGRDSLS